MKRPPEHIVVGVIFSGIAFAGGIGASLIVAYCVGRFLWEAIQHHGPLLFFVTLGAILMYGWGATSRRHHL